MKSNKHNLSHEAMIKILQTLPAIVYLIDIDTFEILLANDYAQQEFTAKVGMPCYKAINGFDTPCSFCSAKNIDSFKNSTFIDSEFKNQKNDRWYRLHESLVELSDNKLAKLQIAFDITDNKKSTQQENHLYNLLRNIADNAPDMIWAKDTQDRYLFANKAICNNLLIADSTDEPIGKTDMFFAMRQRNLHPENPKWHTFGEMCQNSDSPVLQERRAMQFDEYGNVKGEFLYLNVSKAPLYDIDGQLLGTVGTGRDITKQKALENELKNSLEFQRTIFENNAAGILIVSSNRTIMAVNKQYCKIYGYNEEELVGKNVRIVHVDEESYLEWSPNFSEAIDGRIVANTEYRGRRKDGSTIWCAFHGARTTLVNNETGVIWSLIEITKEKQARDELKALNETLEKKVLEKSNKIIEQERLLSQQARMSAMGEMISAIAHQWRQPLNALGIMIQDAKMAYDFGDVDAGYMSSFKDKAMKQISFMSKTIDGFRDFFKIDKEKQNFNISEKISDVISLIEAQFESNNIKLIYNKEKCIANGYPNEFMQVILNILNNAKDELVAKKPHNAYVIINVSPKNDECIISITDNAGGIKPDIIERIFDPYFTTKAPDKGTGIGLYMAKNIIDKMRGKLYVENSSTGAVFTIKLKTVQSA